MEFWISVLLTILGYLPGVLYAVYVILSVDPRRHDDDYVYVA
uniref:Hydrophobic protein OSR8 n=1 Tax=Arundo donax TaxID=35708 RepID=A0A0A9DTC9_ARUDO